MNSSHTQSDDIPAHRVVNRVGVLTGKNHFGGSDVMRELLEAEGVQVDNDQVVHFEKVFWDPGREL